MAEDYMGMTPEEFRAFMKRNYSNIQNQFRMGQAPQMLSPAPQQSMPKLPWPMQGMPMYPGDGTPRTETGMVKPTPIPDMGYGNMGVSPEMTALAQGSPSFPETYEGGYIPEPQAEMPAQGAPATPTEDAYKYPDPKNKIEQLEALRNMAEGLGSFKAVTGPMLRTGVMPQPRPAEGIRRDIAREEDMLRPGEAKMVAKAMGVPLSAVEGARASQVRSILPAAAAAQRTRESAEIRGYEKEKAREDKLNTQVHKTVEKFISDNKETMKNYVIANTAEKYFKKGGKVGTWLAIVAMVRGSGDNRVSNEDINRVTRRLSLWQRFQGMTYKNFLDQWHPEFEEEVGKVIRVLKDENMAAARGDASGRAAALAGLGTSKEEWSTRFHAYLDERARARGEAHERHIQGLPEFSEGAAAQGGGMVELVDEQGKVVDTVHSSQVPDAIEYAAKEGVKLQVRNAP